MHACIQVDQSIITATIISVQMHVAHDSTYKLLAVALVVTLNKFQWPFHPGLGHPQPVSFDICWFMQRLFALVLSATWDFF